MIFSKRFWNTAPPDGFPSYEPPTPKIQINNLYKSFGEKQVLQDVSLNVLAGRSLVIIGRSGVGKSVLLKSILGLEPIDQGTIEIDGIDITNSRQDREREIRKIGMLFQGSALFDSFPVWENVAFRLIYGDGMKRKEARDRAMECLQKVGLSSDVAKLYPAEISGGMQKRVGLARAIAANPEILFFDEPTTGLDPVMADVINDLIVEQVQALGATAISITHDMRSARHIGDEIAMLHDARIVWRGEPQDLDNTDHPLIRQFVYGERVDMKNFCDDAHLLTAHAAH